MGHVRRLRIALADRAGALAQAATVIGLHGGNILSVDVHRTDEPLAVDDLIVEFPEEPNLLEIERDLATDASTVVLDHAPGEPGDPAVAALRIVGRLLSGTRADLTTALAEAVAAVTVSTMAWATDELGASGFEEGRRAVNQGRPEMVRTANLPPALMADQPGEMWLAAIPEPPEPPESPSLDPRSRRVVFVARAGSAAFTVTELARIEALMALQRQLLEIFAPD